MTTEVSKCIDSGSDYCPCYLAETNDCLVCTHLQGKGFCDCSWSGVCIYQDFYWCGEQKKDYRTESEGIILEKKSIGEDAFIFKIKVSKTLARQLKNPGSYVFIRDPEKSSAFDVPMSIMTSDEFTGEIEIAFEIVGVKTKSLLNCGDKIIIKGPFWNGILGLKAMKQTVNENILVVCRGIAMAPTLLTIKYFLDKGNKVTLLIDPGKLEEIFIMDELNKLDINILQFSLRSASILDQLKSYILSEEFSVLFCGGSDKIHKIIIDELKESKSKIKYAGLNNSQICCGEGICGSCITKTHDGNEVKLCKCQLEISEFIGGANNG